jgi:hypothetical protein
LNDSTETSHELIDVPPPPAPAPREVTATARSRSWKELPVRVWIVLAVAVAVVTAYFTSTTLASGWKLRWLLSKGTKIDATIYEINQSKDPRKVYNRSDPLRVWIAFKLPGQDQVFVEGMLQQSPDPTVKVRAGEPIQIRVDPRDIAPIDQYTKPGMMQVHTWTDRTAPRPWYEEFVVVLLLLPLLLLVLAIAWWRRRSIVKTWRDGETALARAIGHGHTAVAPRSRIVRFALEDSDDRRVFTTLHPVKNLPANGDVFWIVHARGNPARAVVSSLYS